MREAAFYYPGRVSAQIGQPAQRLLATSQHIADGCRPLQHPGRSGRPKIRQTQIAIEMNTRDRLPALFNDEIDGAKQQAPQPGRYICGIAMLCRQEIALFSAITHCRRSLIFGPKIGSPQHAPRWCKRHDKCP